MKRTWKTLLSAVLVLILVFQIGGAGMLNAMADEDRDPYEDLKVSVRFGFVKDPEGSPAWNDFDPDDYDEAEGIGTPSFSIGGVKEPSLKNLRDSGIYVTPPKTMQVVGFYFLPTGSGFSNRVNWIGNGWADANGTSVSFSMPEIDKTAPLDCDYTIFIALDDIPEAEASVRYQMNGSEPAAQDIGVTATVGEGHTVLTYDEADLDKVFEANGIDATRCNFVDWFLLYPNGTVCTVKPGDTIRPYTSCKLTLHMDYSDDVHSYGEPVEITAPTCTETGEAELTCTVCGHKTTRVIPALGHDWDNGTVTQEANSENDGVMTFTCTRCDETYEVAVVYHEAVAADCDNDGNLAYYELLADSGSRYFLDAQCQRETTFDKLVVPAAHKWGDWEVTTPAACNQAGVESHTCELCGMTETREIPADEAHQWSDWEVTTPAACGVPGEETRTCSACGETETREIPALEHQWGDWVTTTAPTADEEGEATRECELCHAVETQSVPALGAPPAVLEGDGQTWTAGDTEGLTFRFDLDYALFDHQIMIDGVVYSEYSTHRSTTGSGGVFTSREGSTIITIDPSFLGGYYGGSHTLVALYAGGAATEPATFTVSGMPLAPAGTSGTTTLTLAIDAAALTKVYDGVSFDLEALNSSITVTGLPTGYKFYSLTSFDDSTLTEFKNVGTANVTVYPLQVLDAGDTDVSSSFSCDPLHVTLTITKRPITVTASAAKTYDGTALTVNKDNAVISAGSLAPGQSVGILNSGATQTNAGTNSSLITGVQIVAGSADVTANYDITLGNATVTVNKMAITVTAATLTKVYDGTDLEFKKEDITFSPALPSAFTFSVAVPSKFADVAKKDVTLATLKILMGSEDVTANFDLKIVPGSMEITKRPITIETKSASKVYDGRPLTNKAVVTPVVGKLDGDQIQLKFTGSQTAIGQSDNTATATIINKATNKDVTANYDITYKFGKLTVTDSSGKYTPSGTPKMGDEANMTLWIVLLSVAVVTAAVVVIVYLRNRKNRGKSEDQV